MEKSASSSSDPPKRRHTTSAVPPGGQSGSSCTADKRYSIQQPTAASSNYATRQGRWSVPAGGLQHKAATKFDKPPPRGSMSSTDLGSTVSSSASIGFDPEEVEEPIVRCWSLRWVVNRVGRDPGQIRCPKDVLLTRGSGNFVAVTDSKNARIQLFSINSGRLIAVLGVDSDDLRTARSFLNVADRRLEPSGTCETPDGELIIVVDLNRLLYIDASTHHRQLQAEVVVKNRQHLNGIAITHDRKFILTEMGIKPTVGLHENDGKLIREFKGGNFRTPSYVAWNDESQIAAVADGDQQCVLLYDSRARKPLSRFGRGDGSGAVDGGGREVAVLTYPAGVCWASDGRLLVADRAESRVVALDTRNGSCEEVLTAEQHGLRNPVALATNQNDRLVVTEEIYGHHVNEYSVKMFQLRPS